MNEQDKPDNDSDASADLAPADTDQSVSPDDSRPVATETSPVSADIENENADLAKRRPESDPGDKPDSSANVGTKHPHANGKTAKKKKTRPAHKSGADHKPGAHATKSGISWLAVLALLLTGAVGYGVYYNYQQLQLVKQADESQADSQQSLAEQVSALRQQLQTAQAGDRQLFDGLKATAQEQQVVQSSIRDSIDRLSGQLAKKGRGPLQWRIAEVDYLLSVANHSVILERNVQTAARALADADERLEAISDPALISVRRKIASEINALNSLDMPDIVGMSVTLQGLVEGIERLPLISKERVFDREEVKDGPVKDWRELPGAMWKDIKSLVTVRRTLQPVERLLPPEEKHYLYQNLGLKLEEARIALLQRETDIFHRHLTDTREWVKRYFDPESAAVETVMNTIGTLVSAELKPALPDISGSLRELRQWNTGNQNARRGKPGPDTTARQLKPAAPERQPQIPPGDLVAEPEGAAS